MDTPTRLITFNHQGTQMIVTQIKTTTISGWTHSAAVKRVGGKIEYYANLAISADGVVLNSRVIK